MTCTPCNGTGENPYYDENDPVQEKTCLICNGSGEII